MIPILYESTEQDFKTNGLGRLPEATECTVTEERNGAYELEMQLPMTARHFAEIENERIILAKPNAISDPQPFEIYDITKPIGGIVTVNAKHISYRLSDIPCKPFSASTAAGTLAGLKNNAMEDCPFSFWTDKETAANYKQTTPASIRERLGGVAGSVLDCYGGEYEFDGWTVRLWNRRGADRGVTIRYGKNLIDAKQEQSIAGTSTGIIGYWTNEDGDCIYTDIIYSDNAGSFSHHKTKVVDFSSDFQEKPSAEQLTSRVRTYIAANNVGVPETTIDVSFIDLADTEEYKDLTRELIGLCDTVTVFYEKLGINTAAKVTKTEYDVLRERYNIITLGTYYSLASTVAGISSNVAGIKTETLSALAKAKATATAQITGADGGYVRTNLDADGNPYEILIMDEPDIETATEVWRWNKEGLGHSSTGYNGEYSIAITADGHIVADFMDTGTLTANLIRAGILTDEKGLNFWNMETGEFSLSSTTKVGESTVASASDVSSSAESMLKSAKDYADGAASDAVEAQTQSSIFNKLTNNGETQGIYLKDGKLYINASYIATGTLADTNKNTIFDLSTGTLTMKKGSIDIGDGNFAVDESGNMTARNAELTGATISSTGNSSKIQIKNGHIYGSYGDNDTYDISSNSFSMSGYRVWGMSVGVSGAFNLYNTDYGQSAPIFLYRNYSNGSHVIALNDPTGENTSNEIIGYSRDSAGVRGIVIGVTPSNTAAWSYSTKNDYITQRKTMITNSAQTGYAVIGSTDHEYYLWWNGSSLFCKVDNKDVQIYP